MALSRRPELAGPFLLAGIFALLFEIRLDTVELLVDDREAIDEILTDRAAHQLAGMVDEIFWLLVLGTALLAVITLLVLFVAVSYALLVAVDAYRGHDREVSDVRVALSRLPALAMATLIAGMGVALGLVLFVVPGIYLAVKFALGGPAIVGDGHGPIAGLQTSWETVTGQFLPVFGLLVLGGITLFVVGMIPLVGEILAIGVVLPLFVLSLTALYVDSASVATERSAVG